MKNVISFSIKYKDDGYWIYEIENGNLMDLECL